MKYGKWSFNKNSLFRVGRYYKVRAKCACGTERDLVVTKKELKPRSKSCGVCTSREQINKRCKGKKSPNRKPIKDIAIKQLYRIYKNNAQNRHYDFQLTKEQFESYLDKECTYCGSPPSNLFKKYDKYHSVFRVFKYNGIDRLNNNMGYTIENTVSCCGRCNRTKMDLGSVQFLELIDRIKNNVNISKTKVLSSQKLEYYIERALVVAKNSHDQSTKVGSILINPKSGAVIAEGFNGFIRGTCDNKLPQTRPEKYDYIIHAEINLLCNAVNHGIKTDGCILFCTLSPCIRCVRTLYQAGIDTIYFKDEYRDFHQSSNMLDLNVDIEEVFTNNYKLVKITLSPKK